MNGEKKHQPVTTVLPWIPVRRPSGCGSLLPGIHSPFVPPCSLSRSDCHPLILLATRYRLCCSILKIYVVQVSACLPTTLRGLGPSPPPPGAQLVALSFHSPNGGSRVSVMQFWVAQLATPLLLLLAPQRLTSQS